MLTIQYQLQRTYATRVAKIIRNDDGLVGTWAPFWHLAGGTEWNHENPKSEYLVSLSRFTSKFKSTAVLLIQIKVF
jgi:hypothetical protein